MKQIEVIIDQVEVRATYKTIFRQVVEVELITPYKGLKIEFGKRDDDECNLFEEAQAEVFVKESLLLLMKQIENTIRYHSIYQRLNDEYKRITDIMWVVLKEMDMSSRDKFRYHCQLLTKVQEELFIQMKTALPEINEENQAEFLIQPHALTKILDVI